MREWLKKFGDAFSKKQDTPKQKGKIKNIKPEVVSPKPESENIKSEVVSPKPELENIKPEAVSPKPELENIKPEVEAKKNEETKHLKKNWFNKLGESFKKTSSNIKNAIFSKNIDITSLEKIEEAFLLSDLGVANTNLLMEELKKKKINTNNLHSHVSNFLENQFSRVDHELVLKPENKLKVILVFGVNGSGKTTTIAKLAQNAKNKNMKVLIAAADTFRAAAKEQIEKWGNNINVKVISGNTGEDPSSVVFKAHKKALDESFNLLIIDTAGRLHNKVELMEELKKMTRIIKKNDENAPHNKILVLDSTIGQNTYNQIDSFHQHIGITGIIMTKLDGSAKGGSLIGITKKYNLPIHAIGVGEKIDDVIPFVPKDFINALLGNNIGENK